MSKTLSLSVILPAKNEAHNLQALLPRVQAMLTGVNRDAEIIVIDDGSTDGTRQICEAHGVRVISHPYSSGNGAAVKTGARAARGEVLAFMDADGQHDPELIPRLLDKLDEGYDMVVGARTAQAHAGAHRFAANAFYNWFASWMIGRPVPDLTSGLRVARSERFRRFLYLLPNGFSYPTTSTMSFFRSGYPVAYVPVPVQRRVGRSHIRLLRDGLRFLLIIFKIGTLYSPLKLFVPISAAFFMTGLGYYLYTYVTTNRFTNMSALLFVTSILVFVVGLLSEQITLLNFKDSDK
ncbi:MAG TPA: glycosyltransferase family 2 protein [Burkholderiales bacterium]|nr:glycosyltransferase family 2 protein [Burkholderiales bacterium]